jgi:hypothetical protein
MQWSKSLPQGAQRTQSNTGETKGLPTSPVSSVPPVVKIFVGGDFATIKNA